MPPESPPPNARPQTLQVAGAVPAPAPAAAPAPVSAVPPPTEVVPATTLSPHGLPGGKAMRPKDVSTRMIETANFRDTMMIKLEERFPDSMERLVKRFGEMGAMIIILLGIVGVAIVSGVLVGAIILHIR